MSETPKNADDDKKKLNSEHHTMFISDVSERKEAIDGMENTYKIIPGHKKYRIFIDSFMETKNGLHEMFNELWNASDEDELELRINSWGGIVKEGQNFYNIVKNKFAGRTTTILDSAGYSMGAITFCMGDKRIATEACDFMFHDYSGGAYGKGQEIEAQVEHTAKHLRNFFREVIVTQGFLTPDEFEKMVIGKDYWMETDELCRRGIATHVLVGGEEIKAKKYLKMKKAERNGKKKKEKSNSKNKS